MSRSSLNEAENSKRSIDLRRFERQREFRRRKTDLVIDIRNTLENGDYTTEDILALNRRIDLLSEENEQPEAIQYHHDSDVERRKNRLFVELFNPYSEAIRREIDIIQAPFRNGVPPLPRDDFFQRPEILHARQKLKKLLLLNLRTSSYSDTEDKDELAEELAERYDLINVWGGKKIHGKTKRKVKPIVKRKNKKNKSNKLRKK